MPVNDAERWFREYGRTPEREVPFATMSGEPIEPLYTQEDLPAASEIGLPGEYPYARGVYPSMYRGRLWTIRLVSGFGTAEDSNRRFHYLLELGQTALSAVFDMPTRWASTPTTRARWARLGAAAQRWTRRRTWRRCSTASRSTGLRRTW